MSMQENEFTGSMLSAPTEVEVELDEFGDVVEPDPDAPVPFVYDENEPNLAEAFASHPEGVTALEQIATEVLDNFEEDWQSTEGYRKRFGADALLYSGDLPEKDGPLKGGANAHVPIIMENLERLKCRVEGELLGDMRNVFTVSPVGPGDDAQAQMLTLHGGWQIRENIPDFRRQMSRMCLLFFFPGDFAVHSFYDPVRKQNCHEVLTPDEFVTPYSHQSMMPDFSDAPRLTKIMQVYRHDFERRDDWYDVAKVIDKPPPAMDDTPQQDVGEQIAKTNRVDLPERESGRPYKVLWHETWLKLPNQTRSRYCRVIIEEQSRHILHLSIHERVDWRDRIRYERQVAEATAYSAQKTQYDQAHAMADQRTQQINEGVGSGQMPEAMAQQGLAMAEMQRPQMPPAKPDWMQTDDPNELPSPPVKVPIRMFVHGVCIEPVAGSLGFGYGRIQADYTRAGNTILSQFVDQATLANTGQFFCAGELQLPETLELAPGKMHQIPGLSPDEIRNAIVPFQYQPPSEALWRVLEALMQWGQSSIQSPNVLSGESGKSGETAKGIMARIEMATKQLTVVTARLAEVLRLVLRNNAELNAMYLDDEEIVMVTDPANRRVPITVSRQLYQRDYNVVLSSDLRFATQTQKVQEADEALAFIMNIPLLSQGPRGPMLMLKAVKKCLEARGLWEYIELLPTPEELQMMIAQQQAQAQAAAQQEQQNGQGGKKPPAQQQPKGPPL